MLSERRLKTLQELSWVRMLLIAPAVEPTPYFQLAIDVLVSKAFRITDALSDERPALADVTKSKEMQ